MPSLSQKVLPQDFPVSLPRGNSAAELTSSLSYQRREHQEFQTVTLQLRAQYVSACHIFGKKYQKDLAEALIRNVNTAGRKSILAHFEAFYRIYSLTGIAPETILRLSVKISAEILANSHAFINLITIAHVPFEHILETLKKESFLADIFRQSDNILGMVRGGITWKKLLRLDPCISKLLLEHDQIYISFLIGNPPIDKFLQLDFERLELILSASRKYLLLPLAKKVSWDLIFSLDVKKLKFILAKSSLIEKYLDKEPLSFATYLFSFPLEDLQSAFCMHSSMCIALKEYNILIAEILAVENVEDRIFFMANILKAKQVISVIDGNSRCFPEINSSTNNRLVKIIEIMKDPQGEEEMSARIKAQKQTEERAVLETAWKAEKAFLDEIRRQENSTISGPQLCERVEVPKDITEIKPKVIPACLDPKFNLAAWINYGAKSSACIVLLSFAAISTAAVLGAPANSSSIFGFVIALCQVPPIVGQIVMVTSLALLSLIVLSHYLSYRGISRLSQTNFWSFPRNRQEKTESSNKPLPSA